MNVTNIIRELPEGVPPEIDRIVSIPVWATLAGISLTTAKQLIANGQGPRTVRPSPHRVGVALSDHYRWLRERKD